MFVSSYNTYIDTRSTRRPSNEREVDVKKPSKSFGTALLETAQKDVILGTKLPINYISNYKSLQTKQRLNEQTDKQNITKVKFTKLSAMSGAKVAYEDNSKMFSFLIKPKTTLNQTPKIDEKLPKDEIKGKESVMKKVMVNTYTANENYFRITSAA